MKKLNQAGFGHVGLVLLLLVVLAAGGFTAYRIIQAREDKTLEPVQNISQNNETAETANEKTWKAGDFAVKGTYADADVIAVDSKTWRMYYAIQPEVQGNNFEVYSATSSDGITWKEDPGVRITMATFPDVVKLSDGSYRMYFQSAGEIKSAASSDGLTFTQEAGVRIDTTNDENLTLDNVAAPTVIRLEDDSFVIIYRGTINERYAENTPNPTTQLFFWATSKDGLSFTKKGIAMDSRNETLDGQLDGPDIVAWDDGDYMIFATSYTGVYSFGFDGESKFGEPELAFAGEAKQSDMGFNGAPPGDPTLAMIKGKWFMYYGDTGANSGIHYATLE